MNHPRLNTTVEWAERMKAKQRSGWKETAQMAGGLALLGLWIVGMGFDPKLTLFATACVAGWVLFSKPADQPRD